MPDLDFTKTTKCIYRPGHLMIVEVQNCTSKKKTRLLKQAAEYFASRLLTKRMISNVHLTIKIKKKLDNEIEGYCNFEEIDNGIRYFVIELLNNKNLGMLLMSLAHEMVHLKQYAVGELKDDRKNPECTIWQKKSINEKKVDYWDLPWEIEAYGREKGLYYRFCEQYNYDVIS